MDPQEIALPAQPDGQVNVWGGRLTVAQRLFGRAGALLLDYFGSRAGVQIIWLKHPERIGEIVLHAGIESAALRSGLRPRRVRYCIQRDYPVANIFWDDCIRRMLPVRDWLWPIVQSTEDRIADGRRTRPQWLQAAHAIHKSRDRTGLMQSAGPPPDLFSQEEMDAGRDWLRSVGWSEGEKFVCLLVRDAKFLSFFPGGPGSPTERADRNKYRDSDIATYVPAVEWLVDQGVWVFRMGKKMEKPLAIEHEMVVDYAFREDRSDFLDVWLFANCDFCISTGTGADMLSAVFQRPVLMVNLLPAMELCSWANCVTAPKPLVWRESGLRLTFEETVAANFSHSNKYAEAGIDVHEMIADEVLEIVKEAWRRSQGEWIDAPGDVRRRSAAWEALEVHPDYGRLHGYRHPSATFSSVWLRRLEEVLRADSPWRTS